MIEKVAEYISRENLIPAGAKKIFVAVSGGIDSCVLLDILYRLRNEYGYSLEILHFNHHTRGSDSLADEKFVESLAEKYGVNIKIGQIARPLLKISETYLREQRLKFFTRHLNRNPAVLLATGHNKNDNVETFLMRLFKGSRTKGLLAIHPRRGQYIRPLLGVTRSDIQLYAQNYKLKYREDKTNLDTSILRNSLRHKILPDIAREMDVDIYENIERVITDLNHYIAIYDDKLREAVRQVTKRTKHGFALNRKRYFLFNRALRRGLIEYCISQVYPLNYTVSDRNLSVWDSFIAEAQPGKKMTFLDTGEALAERQIIVFGQFKPARRQSYTLRLGSSVNIEDRYRIAFKKSGKTEVEFSHDKHIEFIDGVKSGKNLLIRFWQKGDSFRPLGMKNSRKLSDFFIDLKISTLLKKEIPLVCKGEQIIWIAGQRLDDEFKIARETKIIYKLELTDLNKLK